ncbi:MAG: tRNA (N6-isopentenyl adenosine(37)-C2)-methylthiotransferase MiaB [Bacteroidales bacterium]|nr:tRNA (N6-isopentenyl adenosine(37)-C2)-methylthiotransferase MiaB [Bacteroidales bacterium]MCF8349927.1 tRNA (N6-isopentenyl adenosine(37)-C2)-methylthiotransferase MiaB [Bacteroidales bacterium]MCF8375444.1 tRNA (N6-isopentenyl adenosine(37)-C2)-methylthiotransferase MiaB [Bacteroidales bacterium]MCF8401352.1 tRNA (N6-isopentenyl adenosine(37)-C2)-methylthiotransferase MiaB [Bacteroidales bacterium]
MTSGKTKYQIITLGCQMNISDSERVRTVMDRAGYEWTDDEREARLLGILACSVRQKAIDKVYGKIHKWNKRKDRENLITFLTGCVLPEDKDKFLKLFDIVFPMSELNKLSEQIEQYGIVSPASVSGLTGKLQMNEHIGDFWNIRPDYQSSFEAFIPIQNGCDKFCTFCAVPYTRGRELSRPSDEILEELKQLVEQGYKSITLLGQNVNSYGLDKKGNEISFPELLRRIGEYGKSSGKDFWLYFTSPHPRDMTDEVIDVIAKYPVLAKQIHLPLQSGDDKVLIRMNRKHNVDKYRKIIHKIRESIPQAGIFTDIIVGFTGETDEQFENTRKALNEFCFNMAYIAQYSPRPGAASSRWANDIPPQVKKERLHSLTDTLRKHALSANKKLVGKELKVLVNGRDRKEGHLSGYTEGRIVMRLPSSDESLIGNFVLIKVTSATPYSIEGELVRTEKPVYSA